MRGRKSEFPEISTKHLQAIVTLARSGKFVAAAAELGISQPGLSRILQQAEKGARYSPLPTCDSERLANCGGQREARLRSQA
jgi:hypothetical protein